ncbi:hypothetical protein [Gemmobacter sp.]|uniref:hypothetical protein n=1 Tax=Gemmobacter sp. TaxID=1898957 RepID=UPI002AFDF9D4|nr:hypothetical protein [Gemmobacter sp.]
MSVFHHVFHGIRDVLRAATLPHADLRRRLGGTISLTVIASAVATLAIYAVEKDQKGSDIHNLWEAFFFTMSRMTTMSAAMANPVTRGGEVIVLLIDLYAITIVSTLAGMFGAYFYHRSDARRQAAAGKDGEGPGQG